MEIKAKRKADVQPKNDRLPIMTFSAKPSALEIAAIDYVNSLQEPFEVSPMDFISFVRTKIASPRHKHLVSMWARMKSYLAEHSEDIALRRAFGNAAALTLDEVSRSSSGTIDKNDGQKASVEVEPDMKRRRPSQGRPSKSTVNIAKDGNNERSASTSSSGSSSSSSTLTTRAACRMQEEYKKNFDAFSGDAWQLDSGTVVDDVIYEHVLTLGKESSLHSFIIDRPEDVVRLFEEIDSEKIRTGLARQEGDGPNIQAEEAFIKQYLSTPSMTNTALSRGWNSSAEVESLDENSRKRLYCAMLSLYTVYEEIDFKIPTLQSESWFTTVLWSFLPTLMKAGGVLEYQPGEIVSEATSLRKNTSRTLQNRKAHGRKIDGIFSCATTHFEFGAIEAARLNDGPQGTKTLSDTRKLAKVLKDMHDRIAANSSKDIRKRLVTYGFQIASSRLTLYSLHKRHGRHYQLVHDGTFGFPPTWDRGGRAAAPITELITRILRLKKDMEAMADNIVSWTLDAKGGFEKEVLVRTLTTPLSSPKHEKMSYF